MRNMKEDNSDDTGREEELSQWLLKMGFLLLLPLLSLQ